MRTAAAYVMPWNHSFSALENFIIISKFCKDDLDKVDNKAQILTVRYHCGGWPEEVNTCFLNSYMVYL
jgi:hypothetical protein